MEYCVYWIHRPEHTDIMSQGYIGVSKKFDRRMWEHFALTQNRHLKFAIHKYGWDNLIKKQLLIAEKEYCLDIERKLRPTDKIGWNLVAGGGFPPIMSGPQVHLRGRPAWNKGMKMPESVRQKVSAAVKKQMQNPEHRKFLSQLKLGKPSPMKGVKHTAVTKEKISLSKKGKTNGRLGVKLFGVALENVQKASKEPWVCPHCNKNGMNKGAANRWHFDKCKEKDLVC